MRFRSIGHRTYATVAVGTAVALLAGCGYQVAALPAAATDSPEHTITATLHDAAGEVVGKATVAHLGDGARVVIKAHGLTPGYHGLHIHAIGLCEGGGGFVTAGGHMAQHNQQYHGDHAGDMPSLFVGKDGHGSLRFDTDAFSPTTLLDANGSAVMVHAGRDNYANIPVRYAPDGPDIDTRKTGDAGARVVCGVLSE